MRKAITPIEVLGLILPILLLVTMCASVSGAPIPAGARVLEVAAGESHSVALLDDGSLWVWGRNYYGALGTGTKDAAKTPVVLATIGRIHTVSAGCDATLALKDDGTVWAWGNNEYGQLGDGSTDNRLAPARVAGLDKVAAISIAITHAAAVRGDGTVWTWGRNLHGQLGLGEDVRRSATPVAVPGLRNVTTVACGGRHTLALAKGGVVWAWGDNEYGQLGTGNRNTSPLPVQVKGLTGVVAIAAGAYHSVAVRDDGTVWVWGYNADGQLGTGSTSDSHVPVRLDTIQGVRSAAAGVGYTLFLKGDGTVWGCGANSSGQLARAKREVVKSPARLEGLTDVRQIASYRYHGAALRQDGTVWVWGSNTDYQLGLSPRDDSWQPTKVLPAESPVTTTPPPATATTSAAPITTAVAPATAVGPTPEAKHPAAQQPGLVLAPPGDHGQLQGTKYLYDGKVILDDPDTLEWAAMSPDRRYVAYKAAAKLKLLDVQSKKTTLVYTMTSDEYMGTYVMRYGFLPPYWINLVGWSADSKCFVVDKDYPGLFKGGCGYYRIDISDGSMTAIAKAEVAVK